VIKTLLIGLWVCGVALGSSYFFVQMNNSSAAHVAAETEEAEVIEFIKTDMVSVPVIRAGKVQGYLVAQLSFAVNKTATKKLAFEPTPYLVDVAYRALYENSAIDFSQLQPQDLTLLAKKIAEGANAKLGGEVVKDVLMNEINYVPRDEVRTNWVRKKS
jgi:flagellar basal body-associated protein FliL